MREIIQLSSEAARQLPRNNSESALSPEQIALGGIWQLSSLKRPWIHKRWCPANILFYEA
jgi:hypothetical protein